MSKIRKRIVLTAFIPYAVYLMLGLYPVIVSFLSYSPFLPNGWFRDLLITSKHHLDFINGGFDACIDAWYCPLHVSAIYFIASFVSDIVEKKKHFLLWLLYIFSLIIIFIVCHYASWGAYSADCTGSLTERIWDHIYYG